MIEAAIDLFAPEPEGSPGFQSPRVELVLQELLEGISLRLGCVVHRDEAVEVGVGRQGVRLGGRQSSMLGRPSARAAGQLGAGPHSTHKLISLHFRLGSYYKLSQTD